MEGDNLHDVRGGVLMVVKALPGSCRIVTLDSPASLNLDT